MARGFVETGDDFAEIQATLPGVGIDEAERRLEALLFSLPNIRGVEWNVVPTHKPPVVVVGFSYPDVRPIATNGVSDVLYRYFADFYYPLDNAKRAQVWMREDLVRLSGEIQRDDSLGGSCEELEQRDGGRPLFNSQIKQLVKPMEFTIKMEEQTA